MEPSGHRAKSLPPVDPHATYLRERRRLAELSLERVAEVAGLSPALVSLVERGRRPLTPSRFHQLRRALEYLEGLGPRSAAAPVTVFSVSAETLLPWLHLPRSGTEHASRRDRPRGDVGTP